MGLVRTVEPAIEPLTIAEVRKHLLLDSSSGEPAPAAPTLALAGAGAGNVDNGAHRYRATFVTADGETHGGDISDAITVVDKTVNGRVSVSGIPIGGSRVTARKLYRTVAGGSDYLLLTTIADNSTTTYTDNTADSGLGAAVPSTNTTLEPELRALLITAREAVETFLRRAIITQTWRLTLDSFPRETDFIRLPKPKLLTVSSIQYVDGTGATQTMSADDYVVDTATLPGRILLGYGKVWPLTRDYYNAVTITFTAGYGATAAAVPERVKQAIKLIIADLYKNRETLNIGNIINELPAVKSLLWSERYLEAA